MGPKMIIHAIKNQIFRKAGPMAIRHLAKPDLKTKHPLARKVLDQAAREFQLAPPVTIHIGVCSGWGRNPTLRGFSAFSTTCIRL